MTDDEGGKQDAQSKKMLQDAAQVRSGGERESQVRSRQEDAEMETQRRKQHGCLRDDSLTHRHGEYAKSGGKGRDREARSARGVRSQLPTSITHLSRLDGGMF